MIEHPPGEETQWDWVELPNPPAHWGWPGNAQLLVGALAHSGKWRGVLSPSTDQPHLIDGLDRVTRALGGLTKQWRFDRMSTVCHPDSGRLTASFAAVAKYYAVHVEICPAYRGQRKGVVEKANHTAAQRWWRNQPDDITIEQAQASLDRWCATRGDTRMRRTGDGKSTVATVAAAEPLAPVPARPYPATLTAERKVSAQALVAFRGNSYSVPPELAHGTVIVSHRLGSPTFDIATTSGAVIARHRLAPDGAGATVRDDGHVTALNAAALDVFTTGRPHRRKERIRPNEAALAAAQAPRFPEQAQTPTSTVIDLATYAAAAAGRNTLT